MIYDTLIIGAGAAGMMCAAHCTGRTLIVDHAKAPGEKIRISGGGRCNFTNLYCDAHAFISENPHFVKSALARYTQWDFIDLVSAHDIAWHEKALGQLFCDRSAKDIISMLRTLMAQAGAELRLETSTGSIERTADHFTAVLYKNGEHRPIKSRRLVLATGGKSIPKMGATGFAFEIAQKFGHRITDLEAALVPLTFSDKRFAPISGVSCPARVHANGPAFDEAILFTHRGLSGPAVLQASSYWSPGTPIHVHLAPEADITALLKNTRRNDPKKAVTTALMTVLPKRLVEFLSHHHNLQGKTGDLSDKRIATIAEALERWSLTPTASEGYRTAEVTRGGISTEDIDAKTMMSKRVPGLYLIGEAVDVTGWLGGYNFQWAWSSAMAAAKALNLR